MKKQLLSVKWDSYYEIINLDCSKLQRMILMNKLIEFIKRMRIASKILFVIWFFCGVLGSLSEKGLFIPFTAILFVPIVIVELCKNPKLHYGNSIFFAFM